MPLERERLIAVARAEEPADLVLRNGRVVNVFNGRVETADVAVAGGYIAGVGSYHQAREVIDLEGRYLAPGFINGHTHLESSMLDVGQYARAVVPHGTTAIVTDLHEIANVAGIGGMRYVLDRARRLPLDIFLMAPSCVPATHLETAGAQLGPEEVGRVLRWRECIGLGEVMNYPGVLARDPALMAKLQRAAGMVIDGHAPGLAGRDLNAYLAAGVRSDHESVRLEEARQKLARGMRVMIREGSSEKNLEELLPLVDDRTCRRCLLVVDDRSAVDLLRDGDVDAVVRKAVRLGLEPVRAIQMATLNAAEHFRLYDVGAVAPGYRANLVVLESLDEVRVGRVFYRGRLVAEDGGALFGAGRGGGKRLAGTVNLAPLSVDSFVLRASVETVPVIGVVPGQIVTRRLSERPRVAGGRVVADVERDILKLAVVERHNASGNVGLGLVRGFGLRRGALASSVAHDSHNIVVVGTGDADMLAAVREVQRRQGGLVVVDGARVVAALALPVAGLLSDAPLPEVVAALEAVERAAAGLGCCLEAPFATLSFLALPVIPELRLTDLGLVDVTAFRLIEF